MVTAYAGIAALAPTGLAIVAGSGRWIRDARRTIDWAVATSLSALVIAVLAAVLTLVAGPLVTPTIGWRGVGFAIRLDALSMSLFLLVAFVGVIVVAYSRAYLNGNPGQARFTRRLCLTLACVLSLVLSGNLFQLALAWLATSVSLHGLLLFYPERAGARLAARKEFLASRIADGCLVGALILIFQQTGTLDLAAVGAAVVRHGSEPPWQAAAILTALAALIRTAQFPLHGWVLEVMETPTPVSALLHAGVINAGGFLILRLSSLVAAAPSALHLLTIVGGLTALFASLVMLTQTSIKVSLAYSTIAQMGFMMLECGLGAFSAALLHILAHALYKAHAFLSSGSVIDIERAAFSPSPGDRPHPTRLLLAIVVLLATVTIVAAVFGAGVSQKPGLFALGAVLALGLVHLVAGSIDERPDVSVIARVGGLAAVVAMGWFTLQAGAERLFAGSLATPPRAGGLDIALAIVVVACFAGLTVFQNLLPSRLPALLAVHGHVRNGLYVNTLTNRWVLALWPALEPGRGASRAR